LTLARPFASPRAACGPGEAAGDAGRRVGLGGAVEQCAGVADVAVATEGTAARPLWRYREGHPEAITLVGAPLKLDVSLPADRLGEFVHAAPERVVELAPDASVWMFGHAGDGNVHVNVTGIPI